MLTQSFSTNYNDIIIYNSNNWVYVCHVSLCFLILFSRNASELKAADILMITVLLHNIFPHSKQAIPLTLNRTPPPLVNAVIRRGGPSVSHHILSGPIAQGFSSMQGQGSRTSAHSDPVDIDLPSRNVNADADDINYPGSSIEDEFYSPPSSPTPTSPMNVREATSQDDLKAPAATPKERFFTPRAATPECVKKMVNSHLDWAIVFKICTSTPDLGLAFPFFP